MIKVEDVDMFSNFIRGMVENFIMRNSDSLVIATGNIFIEDGMLEEK